MIDYKWKDVMNVELNLLIKREIFGFVVQTLKNTKHVTYK